MEVKPAPAKVTRLPPTNFGDEESLTFVEKYAMRMNEAEAERKSYQRSLSRDPGHERHTFTFIPE
jgi:hypothetical protein